MREPILEVTDLHVYYGASHALQGVSLRLDRGVLAVVGRNGMGKTTLCNAIMGLVPAARGSIRVAGAEVAGMSPNQVVDLGAGYVPQGRRVWPSLSVDEHLRLAAGSRPSGTWTVERIYETFPRLADRRRSGGGQLSGGEQQMLAIGRALLANPRLLVMDEPTEGLAPVIVAHLAEMLKRLAREGEISVLLVEQNLGVAMDVASRVALMVNGRVAHETSSAGLAADRELQKRLLGVSSAEEYPSAQAAATATSPARPEAGGPPSSPEPETVVLRVRRAHAEDAGPEAAPASLPVTSTPTPTRWSSANPRASGAPAHPEATNGAPPEAIEVGIARVPVAATLDRAAYVVGTFDTKARELLFVRSCLVRLGLRVVTVDLGTSRKPSVADVGPSEVARFHPKGTAGVFTKEPGISTADRGASVAAMAEAFERFVVTRRDLGGIISAGGSGATALATPAMRRLPVGVPKVMVSTVASGDVKRYVGPADICMMYSVTDVQGINRISERVLSNAAHALAGMIAHARPPSGDAKPAIGLTMFGVTTPCVQAVQRALEARFDCLVFHATGTGGQSMEKLVDSGLLAGVIDVTTTEIADLHMGGVMSAGGDRLGAVIRTRIPYVGSLGALDMVNFGPTDTVPERYRSRKLHVHNPQVTLMRTTPEENARMGRWIAERLNRMEGPVRLLIPEGGVSLIDAPGQPFFDPAADAALFEALADQVRQTEGRRLVRLPHSLNDPAFADALVRHFLEIAEPVAVRAGARR